MDDKDLGFETNSDNTYHATTNLNTAIENPQININSATGVNLESIDDGGYNQQLYNNSLELNQNLNVLENQVDINQNFDNSKVGNFNGNNSLENDIPDNNIEVSQMNFMSNSEEIKVDNSTKSSNDVQNIKNNKVNYEPTLKQKKKPGGGLVISKEVKAISFLAFILLLFIFVIPYVYDFFKELGLVITSG